MRVIALGDRTMIRKLSTSLSEEGVEVVSMITLPKRKRFDLAVVDSSAEEAEVACRYIKQVWGIPVVLVVKRKQTDWERLQALDTDAYIPEDVSSAELIARLRAVVRRYSQ